jgi:hypothetical protein
MDRGEESETLYIEDLAVSSIFRERCYRGRGRESPLNIRYITEREMCPWASSKYFGD